MNYCGRSCLVVVAFMVLAALATAQVPAEKPKVIVIEVKDAQAQDVAKILDQLHKATGKKPETVAVAQLRKTIQHDRVSMVAISPDGKTMLTGGPAAVRVWDVPSHKRLVEFFHNLHFEGTMRNALFSPDGTVVASVSAEKPNPGKVFLKVRWEVAISGARAPRPLGTKLPHVLGDFQTRPGEIIGFSPDSRRLLAVAGNEVHVWDVATGKPVGKPLMHPLPVSTAAFGPDG